MRVLLVTHLYPPWGLTGVERVAEQTALSLTAAGDEVTILTRRESAAPPIPRPQRTQRRGIEIVMLSGGGPLQGRFPKLAPVLDRLFERTLLETEPDVVLISHLINHSPGYVAIAHRWNVPVVLELHDYYMACEQARLQRPSGELCRGPEGGEACAMHCFPEQPRAFERWGLRSHMFRHALEQAHTLVAPSRFVADYFLDLFGPNLPPMHVIANGVDAKRLRPSSRAGDDALSIGYIGVVVQHKGVHVIVDALRRARLPRARLTLFGVLTQPYFGELRKAADRIDNLEFRAYGAFDPAELPALLGGVDIVVVPSLWWETYSIVLREALACGIPVIASRVGALSEAVREGENGLLFEPGSAPELAATLQAIDSDRARLDTLRAGIRPSDWGSVGERTAQLRAVLAELAEGKSPISPAGDGLDELIVRRDALLAASVAN
jgi:glycosyltransferase involved in cell wall biosynthesis